MARHVLGNCCRGLSAQVWRPDVMELCIAKLWQNEVQTHVEHLSHPILAASSNPLLGLPTTFFPNPCPQKCHCAEACET